MSIQIPRLNQPIGESGVNFTPGKFPEWIAYVAPQLEALEGGTGGNGLGTDVTGFGRIAGADYFGADSTAPRPPASPALALELPNAKWLVENRLLEIDEPGGALLLFGVPANMAAGQYGYVSTFEIEGSEGEFSLEIRPENWFEALQPDLSAAGLACIGKVTSDADTVIAIDGTDADVIVPLAALRRQLKVLGGTTDGGADGGEDTGSGVSILMWNALKKSLEDLRTEFAAFKAANGGDSPVAVRLMGRVENLRTDHSILAASVVRQSPRTAKRLRSAVVLPGQSGIGDHLAGDDVQKAVYIGGNLRINRAKRRLE